jgi:hypothetical protein
MSKDHSTSPHLQALHEMMSQSPVIIFRVPTLLPPAEKPKSFVLIFRNGYWQRRHDRVCSSHRQAFGLRVGWKWFRQMVGAWVYSFGCTCMPASYVGTQHLGRFTPEFPHLLYIAGAQEVFKSHVPYLIASRLID